jgi:phospholipase C
MVEENRSFDSYFGKLADYWQQNGYPSQAFDGLPTTAANPAQTGSSQIASFHLRTACTENMDPSWNNSHVDWNRTLPTSATPTLDGFVSTAAAYSQNPPPVDAPGYDTNGYRAMGYYDGSDLNYYYFMASNFATSDRWFSPAMTRTQPNRLYLLAATSAGHANPPASALSNNTIFGLLQSAGISWKIYETDPGTAFLGNFQPFETQYESNIAPLSEYFADLANGTLPAVSMIEPGYNSGLDEHPGYDVQLGAAHVATIINALMASSSWKDSVFLLTFDEGGSSFDHVAPQPAVQPDGISPSDLDPGDICTNVTGPNCDFTYTGYRVPLIVVSPFTRKNYVSHTVADYTAMLKFIETRFHLASLTKRDAAQMDMTEFFDFQNPPWNTPPSPPAQVTGKPCDKTAVP